MSSRSGIFGKGSLNVVNEPSDNGRTSRVCVKMPQWHDLKSACRKDSNLHIDNVL